MRVGWALAPHAVREKLVLAQESATLCPPAFNQMAVRGRSTHDWQGQIKQMREMYRERRDAMIEALQDFMPAACQWNAARRLLRLDDAPPGIDAKAMLPRAVTARVAYVPGTAFFADGFGAGSMRLSFCYPTPSGSARASGAWPASSRRRWSCARRSAPPSPPLCPAAGTTAPERTSHDRSSHRRAGRRPVPRARRLAAVGARTAEALRSAGLDVAERDVDSGPLAALLADPPTCVVPMLHGESGEDGAIREVLDLLGSRTSAPGRPPAAPRSTSRSPSPWSPASASPRPRACACRTRRSARLAPPR